jgi:hypothetical protein
VADKPFACPECPKVFSSAQRLSAHRRLAPDHARPAKEPTKSSKPSKPELTPDQIVDLAVVNTQTFGAGLAATIAPHLGVAIAGVQDEKGAWIVRSRAEMAGNLIRERARKEPRMLRLLVLYNRLFEVPDGLVLATSLPAALMLDTGRATPDMTVALPLFGREFKLQPMRMAAGDVIDYVESVMGTPAPSQNGSEPQPVPSEVPGGVENT